MKKYRLKKKYSLSALVILIAVIVVLFFMHTGYSLWSSKLNISGKVDLDFEPPPLETVVVPVAEGKYINDTGFADDNFSYFSFVSDEYTENSLITTIQIENDLNMDWTEKDISINFLMKNTSEKGFLYTNGKVELVECSDPTKAIAVASAEVLSETISSGEINTFYFSASINREKVKNNTYYKYAITYDVDGVEKYFFYTIKILP